jgi:hypothetical protein
MTMPGIVNFRDTNLNVEGDLLGTLVVDSENRLTSVTPLSGTSDGVWIEVKQYDKIALGLIGNAAATLRVCGSMAVAAPANSSDGYPLFADKVYTGTFEEIVAIKTPVHWLKVKAVANSGLVSAPFIGV